MRSTILTLLAGASLAASAAAQTPNRPQIERIVAQQHDANVKAIRDWIALPTIAAENRNAAEGADYMRRLALDAGFQQARIVPTKGLPGVFATLDSGAKTTLGVYFMYDVKQFDPAEWTSPPLEGRYVDRPGEGRAIVGRGAINQKGPETAFLAAVKAILASGRKLPVNLVLIAEGEEEIGSPNFSDIVNDPQVLAALRKSVGVFIPFNAQDRDGTASVNLGAKGVIEVQLVVGGETSDRYPKADTHSSVGARVANPAWRLVKALDTLVADDGYTPAIEGWSERVRPLTDRQKQLIAELTAAGSEEAAKQGAGRVGRWIADEDFRTSTERLVGQPTVTIQGLVSGYTGPGGKTVLPGRAEAKLDFRLVPDMTREDAEAKLQRHFAKHGFDDVKVTVSGGYSPTETDENSVLVRAQKRTLERLGLKTVTNPRLAGSWPGVLFTGPPLNLPAGQIGIGRGGGAHAPDEWFLIDSSDPKVAGFDQQVLHYVDFLYNVAREGGRR